jgi:Tfp pilus assembly protein PilF
MLRLSSISVLVLLAALVTSGCATVRPGDFGEYWKSEEARAKPLENQLALARLCERRGELDQARSMYESILKEAPQHADALHRLAVVSTRQERFAEAKALFAEAAKLQPKSPEVCNDRGYLHLLENDYAAAEQDFRQATELKANYPAAWTNLGLALAQQEKYDDAFAVFLRAASSPAAAHCNLAFAYAQQGKLTESQTHYRRALVHDPSLKIAAEGLLQVSANIPGQQPRTLVSTQAKPPPPTVAAESEADSTPPTTNAGPQVFDEAAEVNLGLRADATLPPLEAGETISTVPVLSSQP